MTTAPAIGTTGTWLLSSSFFSFTFFFASLSSQALALLLVLTLLPKVEDVRGAEPVDGEAELIEPRRELVREACLKTEGRGGWTQ